MMSLKPKLLFDLEFLTLKLRTLRVKKAPLEILYPFIFHCLSHAGWQNKNSNSENYMMPNVGPISAFQCNCFLLQMYENVKKIGIKKIK